MTTTPLNPENILLTGLARSGTTLTCSLLNRLPNCVALHEPMVPQTLVGLEPADLIAEIVRFFDEQRTTIRRDGNATSKSWRGGVPPNSIGDPDDTGVRESLIDGNEMRVDNVTSPDFSIFIKHPAFFTATLPVLVDRFACFAIVRNPLAALISWRKSGLPVGDGRIPVAEAYDPALATALAAEPDTLERQLIWLDYCFQRYLTYLPGRILRYEDIIASGGKALSMLHPSAGQLDDTLQSRNTFFLKHDSATAVIAERLLERDSPCWKIYDRTAVNALVT